MRSIQTLRKVVGSLSHKIPPVRIAIERIALDEKFLREILSDKIFAKRVSASDELNSLLARTLVETDLLSVLFGRSSFVDAVAETESVVSRVCLNPRVWETWIKNGKLTASLTHDSKTRKELASNQDFICKFLKDTNLPESILSNVEFLTQITTSKVSRRLIFSTPGLYRALLHDPAMIERLCFEPDINDRVISRSINRILENGELLSSIISNPKSISMVSHDPQLLHEIFNSRDTIERLRIDPQIITDLFESHHFKDLTDKNTAIVETFFKASLATEFLRTNPEYLMSIMRECPALIDHTLHDSQFLLEVISTKTFLDQVEKNPRVLEFLVSSKSVVGEAIDSEEFKKILYSSSNFIDSSAKNVAFVKSLSSRRDFMDILIEDSEFVKNLHSDSRFGRIDWVNDTIVSNLTENSDSIIKFLKNEAVQERVVLESWFVKKILLDGKVFEEILSDPRLLVKLLRNGRVQEMLLSDSGLFATLLSKNRAIECLAADNSLLQKLIENEKFQSTISVNPSLAKSFFGKPEFAEALLRDKRVAANVFSSKDFLHNLGSNPEIISNLFINRKLFDLLVTNESIITKVLLDGRVFEKILSDQRLLNRVLSNGRSLDYLLSDEALLTRLVSSGRFRDVLSCKPSILKKFLLDPKALEVLIDDDKTLTKILTTNSVLKWIRTQDGIQKKLLDSVPLRTILLKDKRILEKVASDTKFVDALIRTERFRDAFYKSGKRIEFLSDDNRFLMNPGVRRRLQASEHFEGLLDRLMPLLSQEIEDLDQRISSARSGIKSSKDIRRCLLDVACEKNTILLAGGKMRFPDRHSLWVVLEEVLLREEYFFQSSTSSPRILDCGTHAGMALYYFKTLYPDSTITGFEPSEKLRKLARDNMKRNNFTNVEILPFAIAGEAGSTLFNISEDDSMAGSLTDRRVLSGDNIRGHKVQCHQLSRYLQEPVHFLKMDIEGVEEAVISESLEWLSNVECLVCEYHYDPGGKPNRLHRILTMLDSVGFTTMTGRSAGTQRSTEHKTMSHVGKPASSIIWAKQEQFKS